MPAFRFQLDRVLEWQHMQCELEEQKLKQLFADLQRVNSDLARLRAARLAAELDMLGAATAEGRDLAALDAYRIRLGIREETIVGNCRECERRIAEQRERWAAAQRRRRLLERLKGRRAAEFDYQANLELEKLAGETYLAQWQARNRRPDEAPFGRSSAFSPAEVAHHDTAPGRGQSPKT